MGAYQARGAAALAQLPASLGGTEASAAHGYSYQGGFWDAFLDPYAADVTPPAWVGDLSARAGGVSQAAFGTAAALVTAPAALTVAGTPAFLGSLDTAWAGVRTAATGQSRQTYLSAGVSGTAQYAGVNPAAAALLGEAASFAESGGKPNGTAVERELASAAEREAQGGVYLLRDVETGQVMRTGRTNDLLRRQGEHFRDPLLKDYRFELVYRTDVYAEQRGLEQELDWIHNPPLNYKAPIDPNSSNLPRYLRAANDYLDRAQGIP